MKKEEEEEQEEEKEGEGRGDTMKGGMKDYCSALWW